MNKLSLRTAICVVTLCALPIIGWAVTSFTNLFTFNADVCPSSLVQGPNGNLYGTTEFGGTGSYCDTPGACGTVFEITPAGDLTTLYNFCSQPKCADGSQPLAPLVLATDGNFYGTTFSGGTGTLPGEVVGLGTIFKITPEGKLITLYNFCSQANCSDGENPVAGLVQGTDGNFYGTAGGGGTPANAGTAFKVTPSGTLTTLHRFDGTDGSRSASALVQSTDGNFYGTSSSFFKMTPAGLVTSLHSFIGPDGFGLEPFGPVQGSDGDFYGTTGFGGTHAEGTVFKITSSGQLTTLHNFCSQANCADGAVPSAGLVQATDGNFYGTTYIGGTGVGTVFKITPAGVVTTLHSFDNSDGAVPTTALVQRTDGNFYGTTEGNSNLPGNYSTVFTVGVGLAAFVETVPTTARVFSPVIILGNNLTGANRVTFNGTPANFTVISDTEITAHVPCDATTGEVQVTTTSGTLISNVDFRVVSTISGFSPASGPTGSSVAITGENLVGATNVTFGGVNATHFTVNSANKMTAIVPNGAATGKIGVTAPGGNPTSATTFTVM
jgi:uncharacterized repeat protein (TIGR03803 family)